MAIPTKFQTRVVGWKNKAEFVDTYDCLYGESQSRKRDGLGRISAWKCRFADKMPVGIECTATLLEARLMEQNEANPGCLQLVYSMAIIRFVNLMTGFLQNKAQAQPVVALAKEIRLPEWLVELRHEASHKHLPPLAVLRQAVQAGLDWLRDNFWEKQCQGDATAETIVEEDEVYPPNINGVHDEIKQLSILYQQAQYKSLQGGSCDDVTRVISSLRSCLADPEAKYLLLSLLLQDGYLVPTPEQLQYLQIQEGVSYHNGIICIHRLLCQFWKPLVLLLDSLSLSSFLLQHIIQELGRFRAARSKVADYLLGWSMQIVMAATVDRRMYGSYQTLYRDSPLLSWSDIFDECVRHPNKFTLDLLHYILPNMTSILSEEALLKVRQLSSIYCNTLAKEEPMPSLNADGGPMIYMAEDILIPGGGNMGSTPSPDDNMDNDSSTPLHSDLSEKEPCKPWSFSTADVDWSKFPIGSLPGQLDNPNLLLLDYPECSELKSLPQSSISTPASSIGQQRHLSSKRHGACDTSQCAAAVRADMDCLTKREVMSIKQRLQIL